MPQALSPKCPTPLSADVSVRLRGHADRVPRCLLADQRVGIALPPHAWASRARGQGTLPSLSSKVCDLSIFFIIIIGVG